MNNSYMNFNNNFNNKNYFDPNKKEEKKVSDSMTINKKQNKKIKPLYLIIFSIAILLVVFLIGFIFKGFFSSSGIIESDDIKAVYLVNEYDLTSLKGITDSGKIITIKEGNDDYEDIYYYSNYLYYIGTDNMIYSINLEDDSFIEEEVFSFDLDEIWDLQCAGDYIYVVGNGTIISYNISTAKKKNINVDTDNNVYFSEDGLYVFYYSDSDNGIVKYNNSSSSKSLVLSNKLIIQGFGNKIFLQDDSDDSVDTKYFVYDIENDETTEVLADLNIAYSYKDIIVYAKDVSILEYSSDDDASLIYTFSDDSKVEGIANIVLLGDRLLIAAELPAADTVEIGNYQYDYYLFDLNTKKMVKLNNDYSFIIG